MTMSNEQLYLQMIFLEARKEPTYLFSEIYGHPLLKSTVRKKINSCVENGNNLYGIFDSETTLNLYIDFEPFDDGYYFLISIRDQYEEETIHQLNAHSLLLDVTQLKRLLNPSLRKKRTVEELFKYLIMGEK